MREGIISYHDCEACEWCRETYREYDTGYTEYSCELMERLHSYDDYPIQYDCYDRCPLNFNYKIENILYVLTSNLDIYYIKDICKCERCIERGMYELYIEELNGTNTDYTRLDNKYRELIYCSKDINKVMKMKDRLNKQCM